MPQLHKHINDKYVGKEITYNNKSYEFKESDKPLVRTMADGLWFDVVEKRQRKNGKMTERLLYHLSFIMEPPSGMDASGMELFCYLYCSYDNLNMGRKINNIKKMFVDFCVQEKEWNCKTVDDKFICINKKTGETSIKIDMGTPLKKVLKFLDLHIKTQFSSNAIRDWVKAYSEFREDY